MVETPGKLSLWAIEVFIAAVEEGSVSGAARRLSASVSSVSQQISNLEAALGATLLNRTTRPHQLTAAGSLFLRRAQTILAEANQAKAELTVFNYAQMTRLRLGVIEDFDSDVTPALMTQLAGSLTGCRFLLESGASYGLVAALESRSLDVVVVADHDVAEPWMEEHRLLTEPYFVVAPKGAVTPGDTADVRDQLLRLPIVRYSSRQMMGRQIETHLARERVHLPNRFEFGSYHAILSMVAAGGGWTITTPLGYGFARRFHGQVDVLPLPFRALSRSISLYARAGEMENIPGDIAHMLRPLIRDRVVAPMVAEFPWLEDRFAVN